MALCHLAFPSLGQIDSCDGEQKAKNCDSGDRLRKDDSAGDAGSYGIQIDVVGTAEGTYLLHRPAPENETDERGNDTQKQ